MGRVYTVFIQTSESGSKLSKTIQALNEYLIENNHMNGFEVVDLNCSAGTKHPERTLLCGGFNYLDVDSFVQLCRDLNLEDTLLTIADPDHEFYTVVPFNAIVLELK